MDPAALLNPRGYKKAKGILPLSSISQSRPSSSSSSTSSKTLSPQHSPFEASEMELDQPVEDAERRMVPMSPSQQSSFVDDDAALPYDESAEATPDHAPSLLEQLGHFADGPGNVDLSQGSTHSEAILISEDNSQSQKSSERIVPQVQNQGFDPRSLLDPHSTSKRPTPTEEEPARNGTASPSSGMGSFIERMHGVEDRASQSRKRVKLDHGDDTANRKSQTSSIGGGYGVLDLKKPQNQQATPPQPPSGVVDLTQGDDDDDVILIKDTGDQEVCIGKVKGAFVTAHAIPMPAPGKSGGTDRVQYRMKVKLRRIGTQNYVIAVFDGQGRNFGKVDLKTAQALAPLMDACATNRLRWQAITDNRKRERGEAGPGGDFSGLMPIIIQLYCPRKHAGHIVKSLNRRNVALDAPVVERDRYEYFNPLAAQAVAAASLVDARTHLQLEGAGGNGAPQYVPTGAYLRSVEEIRSDVQQMFDVIGEAADIPERDASHTIQTPLLDHQKKALYFMTGREREGSEDEDGKGDPLYRTKYRVNGDRTYVNVITGLEYRRKPPTSLGGILADEMGLGKTLSVLSLISDGEGRQAASVWATKAPGNAVQVRNVKATLLVCPVSTVANWEDQLKTHIRPDALSYYIYHGPARTQNIHELAEYDIVITTYSTVATEYGRHKALEKINWFRIVLDEAHCIRSQKTKQSQAICALAASRRWAVTGTPVQNRLEDLGALLKFLRLKPFDDSRGFNEYILGPFKAADPDVVPKLQLLVSSISLRRVKEGLVDLPPRTDRIMRLTFSRDEQILHDWFESDSRNKINAVTGSGKIKGTTYARILVAILNLRLICAHGSELLSDEAMKTMEGISYDNAITLGDEDEEEVPMLQPRQAYEMLHLLQESDSNYCRICNSRITNDLGQKDQDAEDGEKSSNLLGYMTQCYSVICPKCINDFKQQMLQQATDELQTYFTCSFCDQNERMALFELKQDELDDFEEAAARQKQNPKLAKHMGRYTGPHTKTKMLLKLLEEDQQWSDEHPEEPPIKSVVFSTWTTHLDLIQIALDSAKHTYVRLDGRMSRLARKAAMETFRDDPTKTIMLVSIAAGGLGLNLTSANKAYVMEPQFNPAAEAQAVDRVHRLGQKRPVTITRFVMENSFEEKMIELQRKKKALADITMAREKTSRAEAAKQRLEDLRSLFR